MNCARCSARDERKYSIARTKNQGGDPPNLGQFHLSGSEQSEREGIINGGHFAFSVDTGHPRGLSQNGGQGELAQEGQVLRGIGNRYALFMRRLCVDHVVAGRQNTNVAVGRALVNRYVTLAGR